MLSYWEKQSLLHYDFIIIGSGIVGLSTGIELKELYPAASVLVLERGLLPTGASSRNAGFACMGSLTELLDDLEHGSVDDMIALYQLRRAGLEKLRNRLGDSRIGYAANGSYELISGQEAAALDRIEYLNELLMPVVKQPAFRLANHKIAEFGFSHNYTKALIQNTCEGELHTGKMIRTLTDYALQKGVELKTGAEVYKYEEDEKQVNVHIADPVRNDALVLSCGKLCICTNAFTKQLLPIVDVVPGRGQVLITHPVAGLKFKGIYHFDKGYYYFREIDGRVLLGGARNLDFEGEATTEIAITEKIQQDLQQKLHDVILPGTPFSIDQRWSGIMAFGNTKQPIVKTFSNRVSGAFRMGGMGVAIGSEVARQLAMLQD